jgi:hypothetical protein
MRDATQEAHEWYIIARRYSSAGGNTSRRCKDSSSVDLRRSVGNLIGRLRSLGVLLLVGLAGSQPALCVAANQLLHNLDCCVRTAWLGSEDFARLVDDEDTARGSFWRLLQPNGGDECLRGVAQQCVRELLLRLEGGVRLGAVV